MRYAIFVICFLLCSIVWSEQVQQYTLDNGLKILVKEDHRSPIVVSMVWYNVGSADEPGPFYGLSHVLEHMLFKGTHAYPNGIFAHTITTLGGEYNALTHQDYTAYYEKAAAKHLATLLKLEADRMQNLQWDEKEFAKEIKVIQEERRLRIEDNPQALALERFLATAHLNPSYQHPVIGWMNNLRHMTLQDARTWYQRYYTPNNATLVIVGDVQSKEAYAQAKQYFGSMRSHPLPIRKKQSEPPALGKKMVMIHTHTQLPMLLLGYTVPSAKTTTSNDPYVLDVIATLLSIDSNGRLSKHLEHQAQIASATTVNYNPYARYQTQFTLMGAPTDHSTIEHVKTALLHEIQQLQTELVSQQELSRVKTQMIAQKTFEKDSIFNQAMEIGLLETLGLGWATSEKYIDQIKAVTAQQIQVVAQRYFQEKNLTEARLQ